ncbi:DinB family protein [Streptomyces sp. NPDC059166]|uniref:DinB family protein n=1 Tax=Streptomyces sp. NPDC059166 TaxID=3346752 RepID=UPI00368FA93B
MTEANAKAELLRYLQEGRDALLRKLEGLPEYDVRRPLTPTGTNLLGLVKHCAGVELGYFGDTFGRPFFTGPAPRWWWAGDPDPQADMWAAADESREEIVGLYRAAWRHSGMTVAALPLDAVGRVPWWPEERREMTLHHALARVISDTQRHAGHADIVRELIDGAVDCAPGKDAMSPQERRSWEEHRRRVEDQARAAGA